MKKISIIILSFIICVFVCFVSASPFQNINPYSFTVGNCAIDYDRNINYTVNPASIGLLSSSVLYQDFSIDKNPDKMFFSQNLAIQELSGHTFMLGYSLIEQRVTSLQNSMFRLQYAFNIGNALYLGANVRYKDNNYYKFHDNNLTTDLGMILSLKFGRTFKFLNLGAYGLDANPKKISPDFPNKNYGTYSALGGAMGWNVKPNLDMILSLDADLVRENNVLNKDEKIVKYGIQFNKKGMLPYVGVQYSADVLKEKVIDHNLGVNMDVSIFQISYGYRKEMESNTEQKYLSLTFPLNSVIGHTLKGTGSDRGNNGEDKIRINYYQDNNNYKIAFTGDKEEVIFWQLTIKDEEGKVVKVLRSNDQLPEYVIWDGCDAEGRNTPDGIYNLVLKTYRDKLLIEICSEEKKMVKGYL